MRFKGVEKTNVEEYCVSEGWVKLAVGNKTDRHGQPPLSADHFAPVALAGFAHALHWYGFWKWFDGLTDAAFYNKNRNYALGNTAEVRFMGRWSDGQPVTEAKVIENP